VKFSVTFLVPTTLSPLLDIKRL